MYVSCKNWCAFFFCHKGCLPEESKWLEEEEVQRKDLNSLFKQTLRKFCIALVQ